MLNKQSSSSNKAKLIYFPHIPKAGGETLKTFFNDVFSTKGSVRVWDPKFGADVSPDDFKKLDESQFEGKSAVVGHLPVAEFMKNDYCRRLYERNEVEILTSVRDPVERIISLYNYIRSKPAHPDNERHLNTKPSIFLRGQPGDFQTKFLSCEFFNTPADIIRCIRVYDINSSIEGFYEYFNSKGLAVNKPEIKNKTRSNDKNKLVQKCDLREDELESLRLKNEVDYALLSLLR